MAPVFRLDIKSKMYYSLTVTDETGFIAENIKIIKKHSIMFGGKFSYSEPFGILKYTDINFMSFEIPEYFTSDVLLDIINDDIRNCSNSLPSRYKKYLKERRLDMMG